MPRLVYLSALGFPLVTFYDLPKFPTLYALDLPSRYTPHQKSKPKQNKGQKKSFFNLLNAFYLKIICILFAY